MKNAQLVNNFLMGDKKGKAGNLEIRGDVLVHYETGIAQRVDGAVVLNMTKYSVSTTTVQNMLRKSMPEARTTITDVPKGAKDLSLYL